MKIKILVLPSVGGCKMCKAHRSIDDWGFVWDIWGHSNVKGSARDNRDLNYKEGLKTLCGFVPTSKL